MVLQNKECTRHRVRQESTLCLKSVIRRNNETMKQFTSENVQGCVSSEVKVAPRFEPGSEVASQDQKVVQIKSRVGREGATCLPGFVLVIW